MIGDTVSADPQLQDEEIAHFLTMRGTVYGAAAEACRALASQYSRSADRQAGDTRIKYSDMAKAYALRVSEFEAKAATSGGSGMPYVGGISISDKDANVGDSDRVDPRFAYGMFDSNLPLGQLSQTDVDGEA